MTCPAPLFSSIAVATPADVNAGAIVSMVRSRVDELLDASPYGSVAVAVIATTPSVSADSSRTVMLQVPSKSVVVVPSE